MDPLEGRSTQTSQGQEKSQRTPRPPYLDEDPWSSSKPPKDESHWTRVRRLLNKSDEDTIGSWQEEINTQLIVSTLLSGLTGAFVIETQRNLSEDPIVTAAVLLSHIATQLNASIALPTTTLQPFSSPPPNARLVNSLLYVSLGFSLSNVTLGILCLQWLRELKTDTPSVSDMRYNALHYVRHTGFQKWGAKGLVTALPLLLLSSLTCFFAGLLLHVSTTDWVVSLPVGVVLGSTFAVPVLTTLLPAVVIVGFTGFHPGAVTGGYPPIPPFHSLQSWIALQTMVSILRSSIFKRLVGFPVALRELKHCTDWGHVGLNWQLHVASIDLILPPLVYSSSSSSGIDDIILCLYDTQALKRVPNGNPVQMKIQALRYLIAKYSKELSSHTLKDLQIRLVGELVHYLNDGADLAGIGSFAFECGMKLHRSGLSIKGSSQLLHALVQSYERKLPVLDSFWDFLWLVMRLYIYPSRQPHASPVYVLIIRALNVIGEYGIRSSNTDTVKLDQYRSFVNDFSVLLSSFQPYTTTCHGKRMAASILFHPVWIELASAARQLPSNPDLDDLLNNLDTLEHLKYEHALDKCAPISFDWTAELYPDYERSQSHISVDMDSEARVQESSPSSVPVHVGHHGVSHHLSSVPTLMGMDVVERNEEKAVDGWVGDEVDGAALNVGTASHTISSSDLSGLIHTEMGDARRGLQEEEEEEDGSSTRKCAVDGD